MKNINLLITAVVLIVISFVIISGKDSNNSTAKIKKTDSKILTIEKSAKINSIVIETAEDMVTLSKKDNNWVVAEKNDYPADPEKIENFFQKLLEVSVVDKVSSNPKRHSSMALEMPAENSKPGAEQIVLSFSGDNGSDTVRWILGKGRKAKGQSQGYSGAEEGQYVRKSDSNDSLLISAKLWIDKKISAWLKKKIIGIPKENIKSIDFVFPENKGNFEFSRALTSEALALGNMDEGQQLKKASLDGTLNFFSNVTVDDVIAVGQTIEKEGFKECLNVKASTFDDIEYSLRIGKNKVKIPGTGEVILASITAAYKGTDSLKSDACKAIAEHGAKWIYGLKDWRVKSVSSDKSAYMEPKPEPVKEEPAVPAKNNTEKAKNLATDGKVPDDFVKPGDKPGDTKSTDTKSVGDKSTGEKLEDIKLSGEKLEAAKLLGTKVKAVEVKASDAKNAVINKIATATTDSKNLVEKKVDVLSENIDQIGASHILVAYKGAKRSTATRSKEEADKMIKKLLKDIQSGKDLGDLAKDNSDCSSASKKGDLGMFPKGVMAKPFEKAAFGLEVGEVSGVVETDFGYHIIKRTK